MRRSTVLAIAAIAPCVLVPLTSSAQGRPDPTALMAAQKKAIAVLSALDGVWRGPAWTVLPSGEKRNAIQTERIGPFLDGAVKVVEGRGYDAQTGQETFNALAVISYDPAAQSYNLRTYAQGYSGDYKLVPTSDGYMWEHQAGPSLVRYTVTIKDGTWHEVGERTMPGREPVRFLEMTLRRIGDSSWPREGAIPAR